MNQILGIKLFLKGGKFETFKCKKLFTGQWWLLSVRFNYKPGYRPCDLL